MIQEVTAYQAVCDRCGKKLGSEFNEDMALYMAKMCDWKEIDGHLYCPNCVEWDQETKGYKPKGKED